MRFAYFRGSTKSLKDQILDAPDRTVVITKADEGTCSERITQIQYQAASVSPTASATKAFTYSQTSYRYEISSVAWTLVP